MADIYLHNGSSPASMAYELMEKAGIANRVKPNSKVLIKPNYVVAKPASSGATTHPEVLEGIIQYLQNNGIKEITIAEGAWVGDETSRAFEVCGANQLAKKYGVRLLDTKRDSAVKISAGGVELQVCESMLNTDYFINVPVLKGHCQTLVTCCLKNMKGCIPDSEKRRFHTIGLHRPIAALNLVLRPDLHIVDNICGDLSFEEGGNPVVQNRVFLGFDPVLLDSFGAALMGIPRAEIGYLGIANEYKIGTYYNNETEVVELGADKRPVITMPNKPVLKKYQEHIEEKSACSACYAALIFALNRQGPPKNKIIRIGQGFRGKKENGIGIGNCANGCASYVAGCPPKAIDIVKALERLQADS